MKTNIKTLVMSLSLIASANAFAGLGGLNVQSNLGEPFAGSVVVTGKEAEALIQSGSVNVAGSNISGSVIPQANGTAVVRLRSSSAINEPIIRFVISAGNQRRQYSAMLNPANYRQNATKTTPKAAVIEENRTQAKNKSLAKKETKVEKANKFTPIVHGKGSYHRVQAGETVSILADRYRPHNMTHAQAVQAIIAANPKVLNASNGHVLYKDANIYIPFKSSAVTSTPANVPQTTAEPQQTTPNTAAPINTTIPSTPSTTVETTPASAPTNNNIASSSPTTEQDTMASAASVAVASENALAASEPIASEVAPPPTPPVEQPIPQPIPEEESTLDLPWSLLGLGGAAVLGLGGLAYALRRRKNNAIDTDDAEDDWEDDDTDDSIIEDDDDIQLEEIIVTAPPQPIQTNIETVAAVEDDEFIIEDTLANTPNKNQLDEFVESVPMTDSFFESAPSNQFNNFAPHNASSPTFEEMSFSNNVTDKAQQTVNDIEEISFDFNDIIEKNTVDTGTSIVGTTVSQKEEVAHEVHETDSWLDNLDDLYGTADQNNVEPSKPQEQPAAAESNSWLEAYTIDEETSSLAKPEEVTPNNNDSVFDFVVTETVANTTPETPAVQNNEPVQLTDDNSLDFLNFVLEDEPEISANADKAVELVQPVSQTDNTLSIDDFTTNFFDEEKAIPDVKKGETQSTVSTNSIRQDWLDAQEEPARIDSVGFVSESVGMAAPLEAKLELAKMYLEIDDAVAARETLRELIDESTGDIQTAAQQLLTELGG